MEKQTHKLNTVMEQLSTGILLFDENNTLVCMNNAAQELLDISERKGLGTKAKKLFEASSTDIVKDLERCREIGSNVTQHLVSISCPTTVKKNISISMTPLLVENYGEVLVEMVDFNHYLQINHDEKLLSQNELATDMLRGLAHEIKNPLGGIRGAAQLLSKELGSEYSDYIHVITEEADRLTKLVDRMLGSSELPNHQELNIHIIMERVRQLVEAEVSDNITIRSDYDPSIPEIMADQDQLIQALLNIVRNAAQALQEGGTIILKTRIHRNFGIGEETHKLAVKIDVEDDGPGIPVDMQTKIFYPMVTGRTEGTGLGLSIAQANVQRHNGIIEVSSTPGRTVFSTILPLEKKHG
ncbi:MAG: PAS domain-containing sensor histidine kinase [Cycloclasticus sp. symbiont of Bathymodiolus heckerae]|nr:MAG: PAS domain-containing sensor histidine kinase [Cycloclasticus sp. symbiont of Bathymodiolus heckerae]